MPLFNFHIKKMIEKGSFGKHNRQFHPKPQVCPDSSGQPLGFNSTLVGFLAYIACVISGLIILIIEYQIYKIHKQKIISEIEKKRIEDEVQSNIMENFQNIQGRLEIIIQKNYTSNEKSTALKFYKDLNSLKRNFIKNVLLNNYDSKETILTPIQAEE